jgi:hypothetical protein
MTADNPKFIDLADPDHLTPKGKVKHSRRKTPRGSTWWDQLQKNAYDVPPVAAPVRTFESSAPDFLNQLNLKPVKGEATSPTYPTNNPPRENVPMGGAKDD